MSGQAAPPPFPGSDLWPPPTHCDEDCLYLNVWTPDPACSRPVIVWIYGGGFDSGSAAPPMTDGAALSRLTGAVVVAANYRLGALGYLHLADLGGPDWANCTNLGLQDQAAALRWVRDNIAAFGGDPGNITVAGQSAGASSIGALLATPAAAGTFHRAILQSGHTQRVVDTDTGTAIATDLMVALGLDEVDSLLDVPVGAILEVQSSVIDADLGRGSLPGGCGWGMVVDGNVLPEYPQQAVADGAASGISLLVGANRDEMRLFQALQGPAYAPADERALLAEMRQAGVASPERLLAAYRHRAPDADLPGLRSLFLTDAAYRRPAGRLAAAQVAAGGRAHTYLFSAETTRTGARREPRRGARPALRPRRPGLPATARSPRRPRLRMGPLRSHRRPGMAALRPPAQPNTRQFGANADIVTDPSADDATAAWTERA